MNVLRILKIHNKFIIYMGSMWKSHGLAPVNDKGVIHVQIRSTFRRSCRGKFHKMHELRSWYSLKRVSALDLVYVLSLKLNKRYTFYRTPKFLIYLHKIHEIQNSLHSVLLKQNYRGRGGNVLRPEFHRSVSIQKALK